MPHAPHARRALLIAVAASAALAMVTAVILRAMGQPWWCVCGRIRPWVHDIWSSHCSQHLLDAYSLTHVSHGLILAPVLALACRSWGVSVPARFLAALVIEAVWEILENSPPIIERYRTATMSLNYTGDSVVNSMGDLLSCGLGFVLVHRLGLWRAAAIFAASELALLITIRDNLTLNVLMLTWPLESVRVWQAAGQGG